MVDPESSPVPWNFDRVRELYRQRLDQAPPFRRRLVEVPLGLHHPLWVEDPDFDLDWHLRHITLPEPGSHTELTKLVADLVAIPLDRTRPLWEAWVIEGLADGQAALLTKVHHAAIDGASGEELMVALLDVTPDMEAKSSPEPCGARQAAVRHRDAGLRPVVAGPATGTCGAHHPKHGGSRPAAARSVRSQ